MNFAKHWRLALVLPALLAVAACAATAGKISQKQPVAPIDAPAAVALDGYDPVAYFVAGAPTQGAADIAYTWRGARWQFASQANRDAFVADPERYAPQYGGYCSVCDGPRVHRAWQSVPVGDRREQAVREQQRVRDELVGQGSAGAHRGRRRELAADSEAAASRRATAQRALSRGPFRAFRRM